MVVKMKNTERNDELNLNEVVRIPFEFHYEKYFVRVGDVLFFRCEERNIASVISSDLTTTTMTASYLTTMRLTDKRVLPEYLVSFLNYSTVQTKLRQKVNGTTLNMIYTTEFAQLSINIPPLEI
jgi:restriction endonuclease S subunit